MFAMKILVSMAVAGWALIPTWVWLLQKFFVVHTVGTELPFLLGVQILLLMVGIFAVFLIWKWK